MFDLLTNLPWPQLPRRSPFAALRLRGWRMLLVLGLALTLAIATTVAASHHHTSSLEEHSCLVCAVLADELPGVAGLPAVALTLTLLHYLVRISVIQRAHFVAPRLLPPSCGPPPRVLPL